jgi:hypothetical protein
MNFGLLNKGAIMKRLLIISILIILMAGTAWATTYYKSNTGTAATKGAATGPCTTNANCMPQSLFDSLYATQDFTDGVDVIVSCKTPLGLPGKIWSESFGNPSRIITYPPVVVTVNTRVDMSANTRTTVGGDTRITN